MNIRALLRRNHILFFMAGVVTFRAHVYYALWLRFNAILQKHFGLSISKKIKQKNGLVCFLSTEGVFLYYDFCRVDGGLHPYFVYNNKYEKEVLDILLANLEDGAGFMDIGANIGMHAIRLLKARPRCRGILIEGDRETFEILSTNVVLNEVQDRVVLHNTVVWSNSKSIQWCIDELEHGRNYVSPIPSTKIEAKTLPCVTLDELECIGDGNIKIDVIKMDVEGAELEVLKGGIKFFLRQKPVIVTEVDNEMLKRCGGSERELFGLLESYGYSPGGFIYDHVFKSASNYVFKSKDLVVELKDLKNQKLT